MPWIAAYIASAVTFLALDALWLSAAQVVPNGGDPA